MSILLLRPSSTEWTLSGSLSYSPQPNVQVENFHQNVDEETLTESDYLQITGASQGGIAGVGFGFPNHTTESESINSITVKSYCKSTPYGSGGGTALTYLLVKIGTTLYYSPSNNTSTSTSLYSNTWTSNPSTSSAWSWDDVDSLVAGAKHEVGRTDKSNYDNIFLYQTWAEIDYGESTSNIKKIMIDGVWKTISSTKIMIDGVWKNVTSNKIFINDTWKS